ncbi:hypothetical protein AB0K49_12445 [Streptomyces decoyicus]|uniref:hypothetical protein n=1 Tax=Streptomyces decoyicus TaxID=249567 RepID=UPI00345CE35E
MAGPERSGADHLLVLSTPPKVPHGHAGSASGLFNTAMHLGIALGTAPTAPLCSSPSPAAPGPQRSGPTRWMLRVHCAPDAATKIADALA